MRLGFWESPVNEMIARSVPGALPHLQGFIASVKQRTAVSGTDSSKQRPTWWDLICETGQEHPSGGHRAKSAES
jgi:hypothetical protein